MAGCARIIDSLNELTEQLGNSCFYIKSMLPNPKKLKTAQLVVQDIGVSDLLINNAGIINQNALLTKISPEGLHLFFQSILEYS